MRVLCIDASSVDSLGYDTGIKSGLTEGETYNVIREEKVFGTPGYILEELKAPNQTGAFRANRFIPCSEIDETELVREKLETA